MLPSLHSLGLLHILPRSHSLGCRGLCETVNTSSVSVFLSQPAPKLKGLRVLASETLNCVLLPPISSGKDSEGAAELKGWFLIMFSLQLSILSKFSSWPVRAHSRVHSGRNVQRSTWGSNNPEKAPKTLFPRMFGLLKSGFWVCIKIHLSLLCKHRGAQF